MNFKLSLNRQGFVNLISAIVGAALIVAFIAYLGFLIGTRSNQSKSQIPSTSQQSPTITLVEPSTTPTVSSPTSTTVLEQIGPTMGWKIFEYNRNINYRYSIRYPPNWTITTTPDSLVDFGAAYFQSPGKSFVHGRVTQLRPNGWGFEDIMNQEKNHLKDVKIDDLEIPGFKAQSVSGILTEKAHPSQVGHYQQTVFIRQGDKVYRMGLVQAPDEDVLRIFQLMLSTFNLPR